MKLVISKKQLNDALSAMSKIISGRAALPVLGAVRIEGKKGKVTVTGTNIEENLSWKLRDAEGTGSFIIGLRELKDCLKNRGSSKTVQLEDTGDKVSVISHAGNLPLVKYLTCFPHKDWPELVITPAEGPGISADVFTAIQKAIPSASKDATRRTMQGILLEPDSVVATDGRQLVKFSCITGLKENAVIPVTSFIRSPFFAGSGGTLASGKTGDFSFCTFGTDTWIYTVKCRYGTYPNYRQVIPSGGGWEISFSGEDTEYLRERIPLIRTDDEHNTVHLYADDRRFKVLPGEYKGGAVETGAKFRGVTPVTVSVNRNYLLRAFDLGFTKLSFTSAEGFAPVKAERDGDLFVFMPLRVSDAKKIREAACGGAVSSERDRGRTPEFRGGKPVPGLQEDAVSNEPERSINRTETKAVTPPCKKEENMAEETKGFTVVGDADPFEEVLKSIEETRNKAKEVLDMTAELSRSVKSLRGAVKARERDFRNTRDLLGKLKKVSGF